MAEYIERQKVFDSLPIVTEDMRISLYGAVADFMVSVSAIPAADVAPVRHGRWIEIDKGFGQRRFACSNCKGWEHQYAYKHEGINFCPICGAKMDGGGENG